MSNQVYQEHAIEQSFKNHPKGVWNTQIQDVFVFDDSVQFTAIRPDSGTNTGGVAYIWTEDGALITTTKVPGNKPATVTLQSDKLHFESRSYVLGYGPDQVDQNVKAVAATALIVQGFPGNYEPSTCYGFNNSAIHVSSRYSFPQNLMPSGNKIQLYVVEGDQMLDNHAAIKGEIYHFEQDEAYKGTVTLQYPDGTFKRGQTYTTCLNVYSWRRQIAGYSFVY